MTSAAAGLEGGNSRILLPLSQHAQNTLLALGGLHPQGTLNISPFCHENPEGAHEVRGWCLDIPASAPASCLPINCSMFDGVSIVRCECSEGEILELLSNAEDTRQRLGEAIHQIMKLTTLEDENMKHLRASWKRCRPTLNGTPQSLCSASITLSSPVAVSTDCRVNFFNTQDCVPIIDSEHWIPELSPEGFVGLYHHWGHGGGGLTSDSHSNELSLYIVCQSYLPKACLEFADMVRELGDACTASEVYHSEEAHWLRQACARNRSKLIAAVCQLMKLKFPAMLDYNGCKTPLQLGDNSFTTCMPWRPNLLAISCVETLHHDIQLAMRTSGGAIMQRRAENESIRILNFCTSPSSYINNVCTTTSHLDGNSICVMAPWEGVWVFHHQHHHHHHTHHMFFPSISPKITEQDHLMLKQKRMTQGEFHTHPSIFSFSCNIPEVCDALNVFWIDQDQSTKKKKNKKIGHCKTKKGLSSSSLALRRMMAMKDMRDLTTSSMMMMPMAMMTMDKRELDTMKQLMLLRASQPLPTVINDEGEESHSVISCDDTMVIGDDVMQAYKQSISKLTTLVLNHHSGNTVVSSSQREDDSVLEPAPRQLRKQTFLSFDENVLQAMEKQGWRRRTHGGYTPLIPLACGFSEHWKRFRG